MIVVCARESPRSAIISTRSRKLSLYRRYQRTQSTMISWSKCRPLGVSGILCAGPGFPSGSDEAFAEHDGELGLGLGPFARRHFPFPDDLAQDEKDELRRRLIARKMASRSHRSP